MSQIVKRVAFIGLGVMGYPMAGHLAAKTDCAIHVYNRTRARAEKWISAHTRASGQDWEKVRARYSTPAEAAEEADFVFACVGNDDDLRQVTTGPNGAFHSMRGGSTFVDHTTASAHVARELHDLAKARGIRFFDAPVSGGQAGAENGVLTVMVGGDAEDYPQILPFLSCYGKSVRHMGPAGCGQLTKMVNQICIAGLLQALSEGVHFARTAGLNADAVFDVISKGAAGSWQMQNRAQTMARGKFDFGFAVEWMRKDLRICLEEARCNGARLPVTALVDQFYAAIEERGGKRWDTSSLVALLQSHTK